MAVPEVADRWGHRPAYPQDRCPAYHIALASRLPDRARMSADQRRCPLTGQPLPDDRYVSTDGWTQYEDAVKTIPAVMQAVSHAAAPSRSTSITEYTGHTGTGSRPPASLGIITKAEPHQAAIARWAGRVARYTRQPAPRDWETTAHVLSQARPLGGHPAAAALVLSVTRAITALDRIASPPPERRFYGRCLTTTDTGDTCDTPIYAPPGTGWDRCPACGQQWDLQDLLTQHLEAAADWRVTSQEASQLLSQIGYTIAASTIRGWGARGVIPRHDSRYAITDVLAQVTR